MSLGQDEPTIINAHDISQEKLVIEEELEHLHKNPVRVFVPKLEQFFKIF